MDDSVAVLVGQRVSQRFREVEVELIDGDEKALGKLAKELRKAGAHETEELQPKLYRVLGLNGAPTRPEADEGHPAGRGARRSRSRPTTGRCSPTTRAPAAARIPRACISSASPSRRLRAFLRAARPLVDRDWAESLREELGWLGGHLGPARDLDVMLDRLRAEVAALGDDADAAAGLLAGARGRAR